MRKSKAAALPRKPRPDFPLFPHSTDRWAKKVRGKVHYFGKASTDPKGEAALEEWLRVKDELLAGRTPRVKGDGLTMAELCNRYLTSKQGQLQAGDITPRTFHDYKGNCDRLIAAFGKTRLVSDLASDDFEALRIDAAKTCGPIALGNIVLRTRVLFKYALDSGLIDKPVRFGPTFRLPSKKTQRINRAAKGPKMFEAADVRRIIKAADAQLRAMVYLGVNCGFGNNDLGRLPMTALDLDAGWLNFARPKTGIDRKCALWPETVTALRAWLAIRQETAATAGLVFSTPGGQPWAKDTTYNPLSNAFALLLKDLGLHRNGLNFYALRHTFRTVADESRDQPAVNAIMGHADATMAGAYRERISDDRLLAVAEYVRGWLLGKPAKGNAPVSEPKAIVKPKARKAKGTPRRAEPAAEGFQLRIVG